MCFGCNNVIYICTVSDTAAVCSFLVYREAMNFCKLYKTCFFCMDFLQEYMKPFNFVQACKHVRITEQERYCSLIHKKARLSYSAIEQESLQLSGYLTGNFWHILKKYRTATHLLQACGEVLHFLHYHRQHLHFLRWNRISLKLLKDYGKASHFLILQRQAWCFIAMVSDAFVW